MLYLYFLNVALSFKKLCQILKTSQTLNAAVNFSAANTELIRLWGQSASDIMKYVEE